jgi:hypothetical protein
MVVVVLVVVMVVGATIMTKLNMVLFISINIYLLIW